MHLVPATEAHVMPVVLLIERVRPIRRRPLDAAVGHKQTTHDPHPAVRNRLGGRIDRKSTRLNSSHGYISYAVFCLKKKKKTTMYSSDCLIDILHNCS